MIKKLLMSALSVLVLSIAPVSVASAVSYGGPVVPPEPDNVTYNVTADAGGTVTLTNVLGVGTAEVTFKNAVNGQIVITPTAQRPTDATSNPSGVVNQYFDIELVGLTNADIQGAKIVFTVTKAWMTQNGFTSTNIVLQHFGSAWENLTTREISSTDTTVTFEATVVSFSPFAVTGVSSLSTTGSPYVLGAVLAIAALAVITGSFVISKKHSYKTKE